MKALRLLNTTKQLTRRLSNRTLCNLQSEVVEQRLRLMHQESPAKLGTARLHSVSRAMPAGSAKWTGLVATPSIKPLPQLTTIKPEGRALFSTQARMAQEPIIQSLFEERTGTWQYIVADPSTKKAVIIDSVLDYDPTTRTISTSTADTLLSSIFKKGYSIEKILETHAHADHLTAASYLQHRLSQQQGFKPPICIGKRINQVQERFAARYGISADECEGVFDHLFEDDEVFNVGQLTAKVMHLPGHTPDHIGYHIAGQWLAFTWESMSANLGSGNVFCGDSIFHADIGTARCDFPGGSAKSLYESARKLLDLADDVKIWTGHDYPACPGRCEAVPWMTVRDHKEKNKHLPKDMDEDDFVALRRERDAGLAAPKLLDPALQINIRAGRLPRPTHGGERCMHLPVKLQGEAW